VKSESMKGTRRNIKEGVKESSKIILKKLNKNKYKKRKD
jgi:hypothetical protein